MKKDKAIFNGTREGFKNSGHSDAYHDSIVFIDGNNNEDLNCIYTHGQYFGEKVFKRTPENGVVFADSSLCGCEASGEFSMAIGNGCKASGDYSMAIGYGTRTSRDGELAVGHFNYSDEDTYFSVGGGLTDSQRENLFEVKKNGHVVAEGNIRSWGEISNKHGKVLSEPIYLTYNQLMALATSESLIPGQQYLITDYKCVPNVVYETYGGSSPRYAKYDVNNATYKILVTAINNDTLSHDAHLIYTTPDIYQQTLHIKYITHADENYSLYEDLNNRNYGNKYVPYYNGATLVPRGLTLTRNPRVTTGSSPSGLTRGNVIYYNKSYYICTGIMLGVNGTGYRLFVHVDDPKKCLYVEQSVQSSPKVIMGEHDGTAYIATGGIVNSGTNVFSIDPEQGIYDAAANDFEFVYVKQYRQNGVIYEMRDSRNNVVCYDALSITNTYHYFTSYSATMTSILFNVDDTSYWRNAKDLIITPTYIAGHRIVPFISNPGGHEIVNCKFVNSTGLTFTSNISGSIRNCLYVNYKTNTQVQSNPSDTVVINGMS